MKMHRFHSVAERMAANTPKGLPSDVCWPWQGCIRARKSHPYGQIKIGGRRYFTHRIAWELANGVPVPDGQFILHSCDNPRCVNPAHLRPGTTRENAHDMVSRGRCNPPRGERCGSAVLTASAVIEIRHWWAAGARNMDLARGFGVCKTTVSGITKNRNWKHLLEAA